MLKGAIVQISDGPCRLRRACEVNIVGRVTTIGDDVEHNSQKHRVRGLILGRTRLIAEKKKGIKRR